MSNHENYGPLEAESKAGLRWVLLGLIAFWAGFFWLVFA